MAIKVDLEKAYDRLSWSFIRDTLVDARLPIDLIKIIMQCIESPTLSVLWNGCASQEFVPCRGIRQGDPLSPYIFVLITKQTYSYLLENLQQKLTGWKSNNLSLAGRITLCQSVLSTIPLYSMQAAVIPKHTWNWYGTILAIKRMVLDHTSIQVPSTGERNHRKELQQVGWTYPANDWIKLNVDGCSKGNPGEAGAGGVLRDGMGSWIAGFARNNGICSSVTAELWAVYIGLQLTWDRGYRKVILESDSSVVVGLMNGDKVSMDRNCTLIMKIRDMLDKAWEVRTVHIYREANCVADWLANYGLSRDVIDRQFDVLTDPPSGLYTLLYYDLIGSTIPRLI
ncbi:non-LTR retroelement reverse transcriptase [Salix suchowensis]|nr:non-LTR retroelement reverse transcriptase [Salix suchowensis]